MEDPNKKGTFRGKAGSLRSGRFSRLKFLSFVLVFGIIGGIILLISHAAPAPPTVYTTQPASFMPINTTFSVQVRENSGTTPVNVVQANLSYPTSLLTLVSVDLTGSAFGLTAQNASGNGSVQLGLGTTCSTTCGTLTGDQLVATLNFKTNATGGAASVAFTSGTSLISSTTNQDILGSLSVTQGFTTNVDTTAPTVSVTAPANNAVVGAPGTTTISATASDNNQVSSVDIYIDGTKVTTLTTSPYNYTWNTTGLALGAHTIQAKATDPAANVGSSAINTVTLADQTPPTTSITSPSGGSLVKGSVTVNANATDNTGGTGVSKVELYVDGVLKATDTATPYSFAWDSTTATNAAHSLTVKAYDNASPANVATSAAVSVTVDNSAPTTPGSFQMTANTLSSISLGWTASTDNNSVTGYRITRNGTVITTTAASALSYTDSGLTASTSYTYTIVALDAAGNSSTAASLTVATVTQKPGDVNLDNAVNAQDLSILLSHYGSAGTATTGDLNGDGQVGAIDLSILLSHYGT